MKGFFAAIGRFFAKFASEAPKWTVTASSIIKVAMPSVTAIVRACAGADASAEAVNISNEVLSDLGLAGSLLSQMHGSPDPSATAQVQQALSSASEHLDELLKAGHIKNTATLTTVTTISQTVIAAISSVLALIPQTPPTPSK